MHASFNYYKMTSITDEKANVWRNAVACPGLHRNSEDSVIRIELLWLLSLTVTLSLPPSVAVKRAMSLNVLNFCEEIHRSEFQIFS